MSYILEALKKLEQKRQQRETPKLLTFQPEMELKPKKWWIWPSVILALLLLNTGAILWWVTPWHSGQRGLAIQPKLPATVKVGGEERHTPLPAPVAREAGKAAPVHDTPEESKQTPTKRLTEPPAKEPPARGQATTPKSQVRVLRDSKGNKRVIDMNELPSDVKNGLPELKMSVHLYHAEPGSRMAVINSKTVREGQLLAQGLKVEQITPAGVIFGYQDYRFLLGINENR